MEISWRQAEEHARTAVAAGQSCKPPEPALEASPLTTLGDIASAMCNFPLARQRHVFLVLQRLSGQRQCFLYASECYDVTPDCTLPVTP